MKSHKIKPAFRIKELVSKKEAYLIKEITIKNQTKIRIIIEAKITTTSGRTHSMAKIIIKEGKSSLEIEREIIIMERDFKNEVKIIKVIIFYFYVYFVFLYTNTKL